MYRTRRDSRSSRNRLSNFIRRNMRSARPESTNTIIQSNARLISHWPVTTPPLFIGCSIKIIPCGQTSVFHFSKGYVDTGYGIRIRILYSTSIWRIPRYFPARLILRLCSIWWKNTLQANTGGKAKQSFIKQSSISRHWALCRWQIARSLLHGSRTNKDSERKCVLNSEVFELRHDVHSNIQISLKQL